MTGDREGDSHHLVAPTRIYRPHRAWDAPVGARFVPPERGQGGEGDSHHLDEESCDGCQPRWDPAQAEAEKGTVIIWTRSLATEVRQVGSRICRFCSRSPILMVARRGDREGDSHHLDHLGSHHLGAVSGAFPVNNRGRWWFIWRSLHPGRRMRRPYTDLSTPPRAGCTRRRPFRSSGEGTVEKVVARRGGREGDSHHLGSHHLGAVSGAFPVNNRGRRWFIWRSLHPGRRVRRPDTDLSTLPRVGCTRRRPFRSSGEGTVEKAGRRGQSSFRRIGHHLDATARRARRGQSSFRRGQWRRGPSSFGPGVLRQRSDRWDPESAEFCSRSPILMVARTKRNDAHETPRHALPREGGRREGDSHHLDEESCDGCQPRWDPAQAEAEKGTVIIWTRSLATDFRQVRDPESADFCSRSPILMVARTNRDDAHETPRHAPPRRGGREGDSHHLGSHHLGAVSGAFPVNQRGRRWFIWRSLRAGRRVRRPDTDLSTPPRAGCTPRRPFCSSGEGTVEKGTVIIWTRSLATEVRQVGSRICRFCSRSPILMVARTNRDDAHETPRHAPPRRGGREGDSHHLGPGTPHRGGETEKGTVII